MTDQNDTPAGPTGETRMLIDGELVPAASGKQFDNVNPATEDVLGQVADAGHEDMDRAIGSARRAFDETDWSTDKKFRQRCLPNCRTRSKRNTSCSGLSWWLKWGHLCS
jgi:aldehyde dehydrogenase (NAD+)